MLWLSWYNASSKGTIIDQHTLLSLLPFRPILKRDKKNAATGH